MIIIWAYYNGGSKISGEINITEEHTNEAIIELISQLFGKSRVRPRTESCGFRAKKQGRNAIRRKEGKRFTGCGWAGRSGVEVGTSIETKVVPCPRNNQSYVIDWNETFLTHFAIEMGEKKARARFFLGIM